MHSLPKRSYFGLHLYQMVRYLSGQSVVLIMVKSCVRESYGPDLPFYLDYFLFLNSLHTFIA